MATTESENGPDELHGEQAERERIVNIIVNGEQEQILARRYTFEEIVKLAFADAVFGENIAYTITYKRGPKQNHEGTLVADESVQVTDGMIFNVVRTDKS